MNKFPRITIQDGTIESLKWLALLFMTIDHANRILWNDSYYSAYCIGRIAMPLFAFVFAYNLARPEQFNYSAYIKTGKRLILFGLLATPAYIQMLHLTRIIPLNIMFTLFVAATSILFYSQKDGKILAFCILLLGGLVVEFSWPGIALCIAFWLYLRNPSLLYSIFIATAYVLLGPINNNNWAMASIPIILLAGILTIQLPRLRYMFWIYYPLHLTLLLIIKSLIPIK